MLDSAGKRVAEQGQFQFSGGTHGATGYPWRMPAENSTRETQPPETRGHRGWIDVSAARPCRRRSRPETATWSHISRPMKHLCKYGLNQDRQKLNSVWQRKHRCIGHVFRHDGLLHEIIDGRMKGKPTRGRRRIQMLHDGDFIALKRTAEDREGRRHRERML